MVKGYFGGHGGLLAVRRGMAIEPPYNMYRGQAM